jgi:hypothetical protein
VRHLRDAHTFVASEAHDKSSVQRLVRSFGLHLRSEAQRLTLLRRVTLGA